ncbi:UDP-glucosyltransferase 2-like isoform X2 [Aethina tumida]|nr:UDP-glucosyltransferase 2-like isoform X2 [Aethina tumida]
MEHGVPPMHEWHLESTGYKMVIAKSVFQSKRIKKSLFESNRTFDLIIYDHFAGNIYTALGHLFKCPVVLLIPNSASVYDNYIFGNPEPVSYIPQLGTMLSQGMGTTDVVLNIWYRLLFYYYEFFHFIPNQNELLQETLGPMPNLKELMYNVSLGLLTSHPSFSQPLPLTKNMKEIGGFHVSPNKELPNHLQEFLDAANKGAILFTTGSIIKCSSMTHVKRQYILDAFIKLEQKVLWKCDKVLPGKPDQIKSQYWLPQQDILAHPNIKLFISHCGLLSLTEAVHHGVPILCLPVYFDQFQNADFAVKNGFGLKIEFKDLTTNELYNAIQELLSNNSYKENALKRSKILHDEPVSPRESAVFWLEYVMKHKEADHLRSPELNLNWKQLYFIDVIALLLLWVMMLVVLFNRVYYILKDSMRNNVTSKSKNE